MNDALHPTKPSASLDERFATRPQSACPAAQIADLLDQAPAKGCPTDEAEARRQGLPIGSGEIESGLGTASNNDSGRRVGGGRRSTPEPGSTCASRALTSAGRAIGPQPKAD